MVDCPCREQLVKLVRRQLDDAECRRLEEHLQKCPLCVQLLDAILREQGRDCFPAAMALPLPPEAILPDGTDLPTRPGAGPVEGSWSLGPGQSLGRFLIWERLGRGGMGEVYRAYDRTLGKDVALKVIRPDCLRNASPDGKQEWVARFQREVHAAARINHEHVVHIHENREIDEQCYYTMSFIEGRSLGTLLGDKQHAQHAARLRERAAELMEKVAWGVQEIHKCGIIHRDLKPANILIENKTDRPLVTDFGLSRLTPSQPAEHSTGIQVGHKATDLTGNGVFGTLAYMAPELVGGASKATERSDIYPLGVVLYELMTGRLPFTPAGDLKEYQRRLREEAPVPPRKLNAKIHPYLEAVCLKCLAKNPEQRYASAGELAEDLRRCHTGETPLIERPVAVRTRLVRTGLLSLGAALGVLFAVLVVKRDAAVVGAELEDALSASSLAAAAGILFDGVIGAALLGMFGGAAGWAITELYDSSGRSVLTALFGMAGGSALGAVAGADSLEWLRPALGMKLGAFLGAALGASIGPTGKPPEKWFSERLRDWVGVWGLVFVSAFGAFLVGLTCVAPATLLGDVLGQNIALYSLVGLISLGIVGGCCHSPLLQLPRTLMYPRNTRWFQLYLRLTTFLFVLVYWGSYHGDHLRRFHAHSSSVNSVAFSPDGRYVASCSDDRSVQLWDVTTGRRLFDLKHTDSVLSVAFSPDGRYILSGTMDMTVRLWDVRTGAELRSFEELGLESVVLSPDGRWAVPVGTRLPSPVWDIETGKVVSPHGPEFLPSLAGRLGIVRCAAFSPKGHYLVTGDSQGNAMIWNVEGHNQVQFVMKHFLRLVAVPVGVGFSPDERQLLTVTADGWVRHWEVETGKELHYFHHDDYIACTAITPDGHSILVGDREGAHLLTDYGRTLSTWTFKGMGRARVRCVTVSADGRYALAGCGDGTLRVWKLPAGRR